MAKARCGLRPAILWIAMGVGLAGCGPDGVQVSPTAADGSGNVQGLSISGSPATTVLVGSAYQFMPSASDPDGDALSFSITGKPGWASFSTVNGTLSGTAQLGTWPRIVISVTDGKSTRSLAAFTLNVVSSLAGTGSGTATLAWSPPTSNTDGSLLSDLAGYRVYHAVGSGSMNDIIELSGAATTTYAFSRLVSGTHYFAVSAYNRLGVESAMSVIGSKVIP